MNERRVIFPRQRACELEAFALPERLQPDEVAIRTEATLVSPGTELAIYSGKHSAFATSNNTWVKYPHQPGYCLVGRVERIGAAVTALAVGDRVFALAPHASACVCRAHDLQRVPAGVSVDAALFAQLAAISLNGARLANLKLGEAVIVTGQGLVGLLATRFAKLSGAFPLIATDLSEKRRQLAQAYGADAALDPRAPDFTEQIKQLTDGRLADVVIESSGNPKVIAQAAELTRKGGRLVLLGSPHGKVEFDFYSLIHARNIRLIGAHISSAFHAETPEDCWTVRRNRDCFFQLQAGGRLDVTPLITEHRTPEDFPAIYEATLSPDNPSLGVIVDWSAAPAQARAQNALAAAGV